MIADGALVYRRAFAAAIAPSESLPVSEWAAKHRFLSGKFAPQPGPWRNEKTPYLVEPMDCLGVTSDVDDLTLMFATQLGKSETVNNFIGYTIEHAPAPMMLVQPTIDIAKRFSKQRIAPMIATTESLRAKVKDSRSRDSGNTLLSKEFPNGMLIIAGANSAASLRSMPAKIVLCDEVDAYPLDVDGEGDPVDLAVARMDNFSGSKLVRVSTPTKKEESRIEKAFHEGDQRYYYVPCPHCQHMQRLMFSQLKYEKHPKPLPKTAKYECVSCQRLIEEHHKTWMLEHGQWRAHNPESDKRSYHLSSLYSPLGWLSWAKIVRQYLAAERELQKGDHEKMKTFVNTRLAETYDDQYEKLSQGELQRRAEDYPFRLVPLRALMLTVAVDTQADRLEYMAVAWGRDQESWVVDRGKLDGNPAEDEVWRKLDDYLLTPIAHAGGGELTIEATAIDTGGTNTHDVYAYARRRMKWRVFAIQGRHKPGAVSVVGRATNVDVNESGKVLRRGVKLWGINVGIAKDLLANRLQIQNRTGPGVMHLSAALTDDHFAELSSEKRIAKRSRGRKQLIWDNPKGARNETWDLYVYNLFCAHMLDLHVVREPFWVRQEERLAKSKEVVAARNACAISEKMPTMPPQVPARLGRFRPTGALVGN